MLLACRERCNTIDVGPRRAWTNVLGYGAVEGEGREGREGGGLL